MSETPTEVGSSGAPLGIDVKPFVLAAVVMIPATLVTAPLAPAPVGFVVSLWIPFLLTALGLFVVEAGTETGAADNVTFAAMSFALLFAALFFESVYLLFALVPLTAFYGVAVVAREAYANLA